MSAFVSIVLALAGLGFLILVHEFGHFIVAKLTGMRVEEFSIGFGPYLVSRRIGQTVYGISLLPLGGYVRVTGMHEEEFQARVEAVAERRRAGRDLESRLTGKAALSDEEVIRTPRERRYYARPVWQRILFIVSGVGMNVLVAFLLLLSVAGMGFMTPTTTLTKVEPGTPAAVAGILPGDKIVEIAGEPIYDWAEVQRVIYDHPGERVTIKVERAGQQRVLTAVIGRRPSGGGFLGIQPGAKEVTPGPTESVVFAARQTAGLFALTFKGIANMISGQASVRGPEGLAGPVGIVSISSQAVRGGWFLSLLAFISVQLAIINMIPLLPLDGGHVLFNIIEKVMGRAVSLRTFERISMIGITLFLLLAVVATSNDIGRLVGGGPGL